MKVFAVKKTNQPLRIYIHQTSLDEVADAMFNASNLKKVSEEIICTDVLLSSRFAQHQYFTQGSVEIIDQALISKAMSVNGGTSCPVFS